MKERIDYLYVGIDPHKHQHTAVGMNFFREKVFEYTFPNKPAEFPKLLKIIEKHRVKSGLSQVVIGLEDTNNFGRTLAVFLDRKSYTVREVSSKLSSAKRKSQLTVVKSDAWDAQCIATVLMEELERLPIAKPIDHYWAIQQLVSRRNASTKGLAFSIKKLHAQLQHHYPTYRKFSTELDGKTSLGFFHRFPSPLHLEGVSLEELTYFLQRLSHYACSTKKAATILALVQSDGQQRNEFQDKRDFIVRSLVKEIRFHKKEMMQTERELKPLMEALGYKLESMTGIDLVSAASLVAEIGDIQRFASANHLARFAGIAPVDVGSGGKVKHVKTSQGNRSLHELFFQLARRQLVVSKRNQTPRNPILLDYYHKKQAEGKTKGQAIVCVMRKLVNIVFKMMKNKTEYILPTTIKENAV